MSNQEIAETLDHVADLLETEDENAFRVRSYRGAAQTVRELDVIEMLVDLDEEYRRKAARDRLKKIAPKRFNPQGRQCSRS